MPRIVRIHEHGGPDVLRLEEAPARLPAADEVRIRVQAIGLNRADTSVRSGAFVPLPLPTSLGFEAAGIVDAVGGDVRHVLPGDAVSVIPLAGAGYTTYGEIITVPSWLVVASPAALDPPHAAALWAAYLTAYGPLIEDARVSAGDHVVVTGASSSVGIAALQIAASVGAVPIALTRRRAKAAALRAAGAAHVIVVEEEDLAGRLNELTGAGPRVFLDLAAGPALADICRSMAQGGMVLLCGMLDGRPVPFPVAEVMVGRLTVKGCVLAETITDPGRLSRGVKFITDGVAAGHLDPVIARRFPLESMAEAHAYLESNEQVGKVIVEIG